MVKVSTVIPAYNAMAYLPEALNSVLAQTLEDFEVIIVDDGSTDHIKDWFDKEVQDPRIRLVSQRNRGLAGARNTGIRHAQGQYIALLDADDLWHETKLAKQVKVLESSPAVGLVYTWMRLIDQDGTPTGKYVKNQVEGRVWKQLIVSNCVGSGSTPMLRRECFEILGNFDENLGSYMEDRDMWLRIAPHYEFAVVREALVDYRQHPSSASKNWNAMARSAKIILDKTLSTAPDDVSPEELEALKRKAWGQIYLSLAWKPLQSKEKNYQQSREFVQQALHSAPQLRFSKELLRLQATALLLRLLGEATYLRLLKGFHMMRRRWQS
ncbi:MAG: glycosyltransferase family A protein [Synechococcales bacterium]|nr:glycosyltransferase family A protein [Synechococcales bacterium]